MWLPLKPKLDMSMTVMYSIMNFPSDVEKTFYEFFEFHFRNVDGIYHSSHFWYWGEKHLGRVKEWGVRRQRKLEKLHFPPTYPGYIST